ncbi:ABC transporter ATP-binding protein [Halorubrum trueperi]|uniref:Nickel import system ATP-binding protein NikD n=1 Tax=Halorubrum trueperi TaxID=2004704 RepID=A0ABD5UGX5_9EURY
MSVLEIEELRTHFDTDRGVVKAVDGVDLTIEPGEIVGIAGESGSGKSVLAKSIMGLIDPPGEIRQGDIRLHGESLMAKSEKELREIRGKSVSIIFQNPMSTLNPTLTVGEQIAETIRFNSDGGESISLSAEMKRKILGSVKTSESWRRAIEMLESVRIPEPSSRVSNFPHQFSGGMRQRALIAMALSCEPDLIIADEPTTALDVTIEAQILAELQSLREAFDTSILLITHDLAVISEMCDTVNIMYAGEIVEKAPADRLFQSPQHPYTQALLSSMPSIDEPRADLEPISGSVPDLIDIQQACHFAPRCSEAKPECFEIDPEFRTVGDPTHTAACLRRGEEEKQ